jgi:hypothetical protein
VVAVGAREHGDEVWGAYPVDETAARYGVSVERETSDVDEAYARFPDVVPTRYRESWLPGE